MQKFVYYPKCVVCQYYKYHYHDWFTLLDNMVKNTDIDVSIIIKYGEYKKDITEVDYNKHNWLTVFDGDILRIRIKKDYSQGLVIFKHNGAVVALPDEKVIRRLHADIKKVLYKWHISDMNKWLKIFKAELSKGMPEKGGDN